MRKLKRKGKVQKGIYWLIIPKIHADAAQIFVYLAMTSSLRNKRYFQTYLKQEEQPFKGI